jgi:hypothetical protein
LLPGTCTSVTIGSCGNCLLCRRKHERKSDGK